VNRLVAAPAWMVIDGALGEATAALLDESFITTFPGRRRAFDGDLPAHQGT
jgi:hypothetical protein